MIEFRTETEQSRPEIDIHARMKIRREEGETYMHLFERLQSPLIPYYGSWTYNEPMVVTGSRDQELREMNRVLSKACDYYAGHYRDYLDIIPYQEKVLDILDYVADRPFEAGTARPDYIMDENGNLLICEITARFFANGYFLSFFNEMVGRYKAEEAGVTDRVSYFEQMLSRFADKLADRKKVYSLSSSDISDSIGLYIPFYHALGAETEVIMAGDVESRLPELKGNMVVSALNQFDLLSFSSETLHYLADIGMVNDFRSIFLLHDKRFFRLFYEPRFTDAALTPEETEFLRQHTIRTYLPETDSEIFSYAEKHKDEFILKHYCLGKSISVYAGCLTSPEDWEALYANGDVSQMILQPFIRQRLFETSWKSRGDQTPHRVQDYVSGTILNLDGLYFGTGLFRTSSRPVINQKDAHKISPVVTDQGDRFRSKFIL